MFSCDRPRRRCNEATKTTAGDRAYRVALSWPLRVPRCPAECTWTCAEDGALGANENFVRCARTLCVRRVKRSVPSTNRMTRCCPVTSRLTCANDSIRCVHVIYSVFGHAHADTTKNAAVIFSPTHVPKAKSI